MTIAVRLTPSELAALDALASQRGESRSAVLRSLLLEAAGRARFAPPPGETPRRRAKPKTDAE